MTTETHPATANVIKLYPKKAVRFLQSDLDLGSIPGSVLD